MNYSTFKLLKHPSRLPLLTSTTPQVHRSSTCLSYLSVRKPSKSWYLALDKRSLITVAPMILLTHPCSTVHSCPTVHLYSTIIHAPGYQQKPLFRRLATHSPQNHPNRLFFYAGPFNALTWIFQVRLLAISFLFLAYRAMSFRGGAAWCTHPVKERLPDLPPHLPGGWVGQKNSVYCPLALSFRPQSRLS